MGMLAPYLCILEVHVLVTALSTVTEHLTTVNFRGDAFFPLTVEEGIQPVVVGKPQWRQETAGKQKEDSKKSQALKPQSLPPALRLHLKGSIAGNRELNQKVYKPGMAVRAFNPDTLETEAGSVCEFQDRLAYTVILCLKIK